MMRHLNRQQRDFSHLVVVDVAFDVFTRAPLCRIPSTPVGVRRKPVLGI